MLATPALISQAATDLTAIGSNLDAAGRQATGPTQALLPPAADEVSAAVTRLFAHHAEDFQKAAAQASAYHEQFVQKIAAAAGSYAGAEAVNADWLLQTLGAIAQPIVGQGFLGFINAIFWIASLPPPLPSILLFPLYAPFGIALFSIFFWLFLGFPLIITVTRPLLAALFPAAFA